MKYFPVFLSIVFVVRNQALEIVDLTEQLTAAIAPIVSDYELIIIDNASEDDSIEILKQVTKEHGFPNLQVYALTKGVDADTASWVGLENALGDFVAVIEPLVDDIYFLPTMLERAMSGADVVFAMNKQRPKQSMAYRSCFWFFRKTYKLFNGIDMMSEAPRFRLLSKRVINFVLQHPAPALSYRYLPATAGFSKVNLAYSSRPQSTQKKKLRENIDLGMRLMVATTYWPMRLVTSLSLFGAFSNVVYSIYVIAIALSKPDVAPGWTTLSLQQSGMFFLISLVLAMLSEYILHMSRLSNEGPPYHVAQEFTSAVITRHQKLNLEEAETSKRHLAD
ncbi:glycosyltransferase [Nodosilinea sp. E11]|uniref:glycosyltransferase n=1 Tax=Nodosilinea sp. E11 TaxID=3037479 RepID=UPI0029348F4F|nr:glycosyltransferase [Nodosilinea sp. E11]WOD40419.1 glycosyltransferase [Nodosilinea sp. E11]